MIDLPEDRAVWKDMNTVTFRNAGADKDDDDEDVWFPEILIPMENSQTASTTANSGNGLETGATGDHFSAMQRVSVSTLDCLSRDKPKSLVCSHCFPWMWTGLVGCGLNQRSTEPYVCNVRTRLNGARVHYARKVPLHCGSGGIRINSTSWSSLKFEHLHNRSNGELTFILGDICIFVSGKGHPFLATFRGEY